MSDQDCNVSLLQTRSCSNARRTSRCGHRPALPAAAHAPNALRLLHIQADPGALSAHSIILVNRMLAGGQYPSRARVRPGTASRFIRAGRCTARNKLRWLRQVNGENKVLSEELNKLKSGAVSADKSNARVRDTSFAAAFLALDRCCDRRPIGRGYRFRSLSVSLAATGTPSIPRTTSANHALLTDFRQMLVSACICTSCDRGVPTC